jgi:hypothetical protein
MAKNVQCAVHGGAREAFVCAHLLGETAGLGFNRDEPTDENPFPDAWCDDCEIIRSAHDGWTEESEKLVKISLLCSGCYERSRIRNTRTGVTLGDLAGLRWKCGSCEKWHTGPCLDIGFVGPQYWRREYGEANPDMDLSSSANRPNTFLTRSFCAIDEDFFVRGIIRLPILGTAETFRWGVWGSVSRQNFDTLIKMDDDPKRAELPPIFSWLSSRIPEYPETLNLKMHARTRDLGQYPDFGLELSDHLLSQEFHHGISAERVKQIMFARLPAVED